MSARKYHINPETGRPNLCTATVKGCKYAENGEIPEHYETKEEARESYESKMSDKKILSHSRKSSKKTPTSQNNTQKEQSKEKYDSKDAFSTEGYTSKDYSERLRKADPNLIYQNGNCEAIASYLWNTNDNVEEYYYLKTQDEPDFGIHQIVKLRSGYYADSLGIWSKKEIESHWQKIDSTSKIEVLPNTDNLPRDKNTKDYSNGLNAIMEEMIEDHMKKYTEAGIKERVRVNKKLSNSEKQQVKKNNQDKISEIDKREQSLIRELAKSEAKQDSSIITPDDIEEYYSKIKEVESLLEEANRYGLKRSRINYLERCINSSKINKAFLELDLHLTTKTLTKPRFFHSKRTRNAIESENKAIKDKEENLISELKNLINRMDPSSLEHKDAVELRNARNYEKYKNILKTV